MCKVAVIVPVYNVKSNIVQCADSLFSQTLNDMQFIFVDDASPDNSVDLIQQTLEHYPQRKSQTLILHHPKNLGLPVARATGLAHVKASYVAHCDSDDFVAPDMYEKLYKNAIQNNSDMVICGRIDHYANGKEHIEFDNPYSNNSLIENFLHCRLCGAVWCRLTKTNIYRHVQFPVDSYFEDIVQTAQLLTFVQRVSFIHEALYHYNRHRPSSITTDQRMEMIEKQVRQGLNNFKILHDFIVAHHKVKEKDFIVFKSILRCRYLPQIKRRNIRKKYLQTFPEINFDILFNRNVPRLHKWAHFLVLIGLYPYVRPLYDKLAKQ